MATNSTPKTQKTLSCKRCQYMRVKCSRSEPCQACQKAGVVCEYRQVDRKRKPASQDHVQLLQNRVSWLEGFITDLQQSSASEREAKLRSVSFISTPFQDIPSSSTVGSSSSAASPRTANFHLTRDGSLSFHGRTSIYQTISEDVPKLGGDAPSGLLAAGRSRNTDHVLHYFNIDLEDEKFTQALNLFFKWQYPNFMFIYRDAFLSDHFGTRHGSKYWSLSLLLSICALGSLMFPTNEEREFGSRCHDAAESIAMVTDLVNPSITAVQTFLCLAFYDIGAGSLSKGWAFSGIAFRMAQDLGFQKDSELWPAHAKLFNTREDVELRRRIYWGCYLSDKVISLIFGRPVQLKYSEAEVYALETQPDPSYILPWRSVGFDDDAATNYTDISMIPYIKEQIKLARVLERMLGLMSSTSDRIDALLQRQSLDSLNYDLLQWRKGLAEWADFTVWAAIDKPLKPNIAGLHLLYNSARIALNFDEATSPDTHESRIHAREACTLAATEIHSILRRFRNQHGLANSPLIIVYAVAQAARASKAFGTPEETKNLRESMADLGGTWALAESVMSQGPRGSKAAKPS